MRLDEDFHWFSLVGRKTCHNPIRNSRSYASRIIPTTDDDFAELPIKTDGRWQIGESLVDCSIRVRSHSACD